MAPDSRHLGLSDCPERMRRAVGATFVAAGVTLGGINKLHRHFRRVLTARVV